MRKTTRREALAGLLEQLESLAESDCDHHSLSLIRAAQVLTRELDSADESRNVMARRISIADDMLDDMLEKYLHRRATKLTHQIIEDVRAVRAALRGES